ncbi:MAG: hypothetical protein K6G03_03970 [Lachnospiraceae bacterium]|nr:hypothetical protein [Lachnospiraceae bacterium]
MSNVVKGFNAEIDAEDKQVIDSNAMVAERIKLLQTILKGDQGSDAEGEGEFTEGLDADMLSSILDDPDAAEGGNVIKGEPQAPPQPAIDLEAINAEAEQIIEDAKAQADLILQEAMDEAEVRKAAVYDEARQTGHNEGYNAGMQEVEAMKAELMEQQQAMAAQYDQMVSELEPAMIETLSDIYGHVFHTDLSDKKEIILYLLQNALQNADTTANLMVHVSKDDYEYISSNKAALFDGIPGEDNTDIVPDVTLSSGEVMIDTGSGIFDCSLGTELEGLRKQLVLLSYRKGDEEA